MTVAGATIAAAPLRKRVRRESFTEWLPKSSHPRFSVNYVSFPVRQQTPGSLCCHLAPALTRESSQRNAPSRNRLLLLPGRRFGRLRGGAGIRGLRQRRRIVRLGVQERDHVGALAAARKPRKAHLGA